MKHLRTPTYLNNAQELVSFARIVSHACIIKRVVNENELYAAWSFAQGFPLKVILTVPKIL